MDWDDLHTFLAIARHGTLSGAARALGVTQPTMGRRLAALEARSGARLLQRHPQGYALTSIGEAVLGNAERIEAEVMSAERTITGRDVALAGVVRVTTVDTLAAQILTPALAALQCTHPGIVIELISDQRSLSLSKREADIAVRMTQFEGHELVSRKLGSLKLGLYASPTYLARYPLAQATHKIVTVLEDQAHLPEVKWLHAQFPQATIAFRSNSREVQLWAAKSGVGIAALACHRAVAEPDLVPLMPHTAQIARDVWLGVHSDMRHMPRIRAVVDVIVAAFRVLDT